MSEQVLSTKSTSPTFVYQDIVVYVSTEAQMLDTSKPMLHAYFIYVSLQRDTNSARFRGTLWC